METTPATLRHAFGAKALAAFALACAVSGFAAPRLAAQSGAVVSFVQARNLSADPRADYLAGVIEGIVLYDLSKAEGVTLVDRASMEKVLREQELQLSGLVDDRTAAIQVGKLLGASWLLMIDYVPLSGEVTITAKLVAVGTGKVSAFTERGSTENTIHKLSETLIEVLTGRKVACVDPGAERSILSLKDETPGSIALHSIMIGGEIFVDGEFAGYTTGNVEKPFLIEDLLPGKHSVRLHVGNQFGLIKLPEVSFHDWEIVVDVKPGKRHVVRDETRHFNDILYDLIQLYSADITIKAKDWSPLAKPVVKSFVDRKGAAVTATLSLNPKDSGGALTLTPELAVNGEKKTLGLIAPKKGEDRELELACGPVTLFLELDWRYDALEIDIRLERNDIWQNMYDD